MSDLDFAHSLADAADTITMARFGSQLHVETKHDHTFVTDADRSVEHTIRDLLNEFRPSDGIIGEEFGNSQPTARRRWVIDPIDGTNNYLRGVPVWATLIALLEDQTPIVGVVSAPALGRRWFAAKDQGAFVRDQQSERQIRVSGITTLADASVSYSDEKNWDDLEKFHEVLSRCWRSRAYGDFWSHMMVAEGVVDVAMEPQLSLWDIAALEIVIREAGGRLTGTNGIDGPHQRSAISSNGHLHPIVLDLLA